MFTLKKNNYNHNGVCIYEDEVGNSVFCRRSATGFVSKLRFADTAIKAEPLYTNIPLKDDIAGVKLRINYPKNVRFEDYQPVIDAYNAIVDRWASMCYDLEIMQKRKSLGQSITEDINELRKYEELSGIILELMC